MNDKALAAQALSACDRLEQGVKDGDQVSIDALKAMVARWAGSDFDQVKTQFAVAFREMMRKCAQDGQEGLAMAMAAIRCLTEYEVSRIFGNGGKKDEP